MTFDIFSGRLPAELRLMIFEEVASLDDGYDGEGNGHPTLRDLSLTCKQVRAEVRGILHRITRFSFDITCYIGNEKPLKDCPHGINTHCVIGISSTDAAVWNVPDSPIALAQEHPETSGLKHINECKIDVLFLGRPIFEAVPRDERLGFMKQRFELCRQTLSEVLSQIFKLAPRLEAITIGHHYADYFDVGLYYQDWLDDVYPSDWTEELLNAIFPELQKGEGYGDDKHRFKLRIEARYDSDFPWL